MDKPHFFVAIDRTKRYNRFGKGSACPVTKESTVNEPNDLYKSAKFNVREGNYAKVGDFWKNIVFFWQHDRIYYITEGTATLVLKGRRLPLKPNHLYYIPAYSVVTAECDVFLGHYYLHFEWDKANSPFLSMFNLTSETEGTPLHLSLIQRAIDIVNSADNASSKAQLELNGIMQILTSAFISSNNAAEQDAFRFLDILKFIDENLDRRITVRELAAQANLNEVYFSNLFKRMFDISPLQYVLNKKISHSMLLLKNTKLSVKEIAYKIGFDDELYFSRIFKNKTGLSPKMFREEAQEPPKSGADS